MANHASAKKRHRQTIKRTERNRHIRTTVRTFIKRVRTAIEVRDSKAAQGALAVAVSAIDKAVAKGVYPRETGSRYIARLSSQVAKVS